MNTGTCPVRNERKIAGRKDVLTDMTVLNHPTGTFRLKFNKTLVKCVVEERVILETKGVATSMQLVRPHGKNSHFTYQIYMAIFTSFFHGQCQTFTFTGQWNFENESLFFALLAKFLSWIVEWVHRLAVPVHTTCSYFMTELRRCPSQIYLTSKHVIKNSYWFHYYQCRLVNFSIIVFRSF